LEIRELECKACDLQVRGHFGQRGRYEQLSHDQAAFLEAFLRCRGVLRDVEAALGISYPTVRTRLDQLLIALGLAQTDRSIVTSSAPRSLSGDLETRRRNVLASLDSGEIDAESAARALRELN
jgi:hypothetical protein